MVNYGKFQADLLSMDIFIIKVQLHTAARTKVNIESGYF